MRPNVCVVDDEPRVRASLVDLLQSEDISAVAYASVEDFLEALEPQECACVIADLRMPGMSGLELRQQLMDQHFDIPVILLTGYRDTSTHLQAEAIGIYAVLEKPYPPRDLVELTQKAISGYQVN